MPHCMVSQSIWSIDFSIYGTQQLALLLWLEGRNISQILRSLHWLPVYYRIAFYMLLLTYKALNGLSPDYIKDLLRYNDSRRTLRFSSKRLLDEPVANLKTYGERTFFIAAPRFWNKLSLQTRFLSSETIFKANLKTYLFKRAFDL